MPSISPLVPGDQNAHRLIKLTIYHHLPPRFSETPLSKIPLSRLTQASVALLVRLGHPGLQCLRGTDQLQHGQRAQGGPGIKGLVVPGGLRPRVADQTRRVEVLGKSFARNQHSRSILATSNKKLLGAPGLTTRSKDATRGSWHRY